MGTSIVTNKEMGSRIRERREMLDYTRENLAEKIDKSNTYICQLEQGKKGMSVTTLAKLCEVLHVSADYIIFGKKESITNSDIFDSLSTINPVYTSLAEEWVKLLIKTLDAE